MITFLQGSTRNVFLIGKLAIKIPRFVEWKLFLHGLLANIQENTFSKTKWKELCPVLFYVYGGFLIVMKRARPLTENEWCSINLDNWGKYEDYEIPVEMKRDSFGVIGDKIVAVDYGS